MDGPAKSVHHQLKTVVSPIIIVYNIYRVSTILLVQDFATIHLVSLAHHKLHRGGYGQLMAIKE